MALTDLTRISTSGIATGTSLSGAIPDVDILVKSVSAIYIFLIIYETVKDGWEFAPQPSNLPVQWIDPPLPTLLLIVTT